MKTSSKSVIIFGVINVLIQVLIPVINLPTLSWYDFVLPALSGVLIFLGKNMTGKGWTISGQIGASFASFMAVHPTPDGVTLKYVVAMWLLPVLLQVIGIIAPSGTNETKS